MKNLPIGIQYFPTLVRDNYLYVDKTELIFKLIQKKGRGYFLARPRRFGKSLLLSTLASVFQGQKELFKDTWIFNADYSWEKYPVLWLDFSTIHAETKESLEESLHRILEVAAQDLGLSLERGPSAADTFINLIRISAQSSSHSEVVILIDEYDKPLTSQFGSWENLEVIRNVMQSFFVVIKSLGKYVRYAFITGVSKFSKVSLFSGMNNLEDITLDAEYATITGITEFELDRYYSDWINEAAQKRGVSVLQTQNLMRQWYNGYCFSGQKLQEKVYNPVSVHFFLEKVRLANYWFGTATPTFAIQMIQHQNYPLIDLEHGIVVKDSLEEHHEITRPDLIPLLFQTGYLTISDYDEAQSSYRLSFPNEEVRRSFFNHLLKGFTNLDDSRLSGYENNLKKSILETNLEEFFLLFNQLLAEIPYTLHIAQEAYYHSLIYLVIRTLDISASCEVLTSRGRLDLLVTLDSTLYIMEFKFEGTAKQALKQIEQMGYSDSYQKQNKKIILIGANFNCKERKVDEWISKSL